MSRRAKRKDAEFLTQCQVLVDRWQQATDPSAFGLTGAEVDQFLETVLNAADSQGKARRARLLAKARFVAQREAFAELRGLFGALSGSIDVKAKRAGTGKARGVYAAAGIDPPERGGPRPAPGEPFGLAYSMRTNGEIEARFEIDDHARGGLLYEVQRRLVALDGDASPWLPLDVVAEKRFVDRDVPAGVLRVQYQVRAMRVNGKKGDWSCALSVPFGTIHSAGAGAGAGGDAGDGLEQPGKVRSRRAG